MTVQTNNNSISYVGNGSTAHFDYDYLILDASHLKVYFGDVLQTSGYVVSGVSSQTGGTVAFAVAPPNGTNITLIRDVPFLQLTDYQPYDAFPAESHERALDLLTMMTQQLKDELGRTMQYPVGGDKWDARGNEIINVGTGGSGTSATNVDQVKYLIASEVGDDPSASASARSREALRRSYAEAGFNLVTGSFELGGTVTTATDVLLYEADGKAYSWGGTLPIAAASNSTPAPLESGGWIDRSDVTLRGALREFDGLLSANPGWDDIPSHSDPGLGAELNAQAKALMSRTEDLKEKDAKLDVRVNGRNDVDGNWMKAISDIEVAYNRLGATLDGNIVHRVDFTAAQTDTQSRLLYALQNIPSGHVFERFIAFGSLYTTMSIRPVAARVSVGKPTFSYGLVSYEGNDYHTVTVSGEFASKFRMSYYDGVLRQASEVINYLGLRYVRLLVNASPVGSTGVDGFCTTINNGKLIQGDPNNTYFISSCFFSADGKLHVVPHKDTPVEQVVRNYYYNHDAVQAMHFRYVLVKDGAVYDLVANGYTTQVGWDGQPSGRTSIGQKANGDLVFAVIDGSTTAGTGVTVKRMSEYMLSRGCVDAMNLDGSGSSVMYYANERKNSPSDGQERQSPNFIYFL